MRLTSLFLWGSILAGAGCAPTQDARAPRADPPTPPVPYAAESRSSAQGSSGTAGTVSGKDDTAPPRGDPSAGMPPPRTEPHQMEAPRQDELPPAQRY